MKSVSVYLFLTFLKIGSASWGGFMALISMIQKKVVEKDRMLDNATGAGRHFPGLGIAGAYGGEYRLVRGLPAWGLEGRINKCRGR